MRSKHPDCTCELVTHLHGKRTTYNTHKCRCEPCRKAAAAYRKSNYRRRMIEQWNPESARFVDADPVRAHIEHLREQGMTYQQMAKLAKVGNSYITYLMNGKAGREGPPERVRREHAERILAITYSPQTAARRIDATGSRRRVRALVAVGWTVKQIADELGINYTTLRVHRDSYDQRIDADRAKEIRKLYERWWNVTPTGQPASRAHSDAKRKGWAPPMAWDDDTIDDPNAKPVGVRTSNPRSITDRDELLWLVEQAESMADLASMLNVAHDYARLLMAQHNIPQPRRFAEAVEVLSEYRKGIRRTKFKQGRSA